MRIEPLLLTALLALTMGAVAAGCGSDRQTGPQNSYMQARAAQTAAAGHCNCFTALGYASASSCEGEFIPNAISTEKANCIDGLYTSSATSLNGRFLCIEESAKTYDTCMSAVAACDSASVTACSDALGAMIAACPALDAGTQASFDACLTSAP